MPKANSTLSPAVFAEPARQLTPKQQRYVDHYVANGGNQGEAARAAGYPPKSADGQASRNMRNPLIQQAILKATAQRIGFAAVPALNTVIGLSAAAKSEYVRLEASRDLLDRAGFRPPERVDHRVDASLTVSIDLG